MDAARNRAVHGARSRGRSIGRSDAERDQHIVATRDESGAREVTQVALQPEVAVELRRDIARMCRRQHAEQK